MGECNIRKRIAARIFEQLFKKIKGWEQQHPLERLHYVKSINYKTGSIFDTNRSSVEFEMYNDDLNEYDKFMHIGRWQLTLDPLLDYPVCLCFHSKMRHSVYYLFSDCCKFCPIFDKQDMYWHREFDDQKVIEFLKLCMDITYNKYSNQWLLPKHDD